MEVAGKQNGFKISFETVYTVELNKAMRLAHQLLPKPPQTQYLDEMAILPSEKWKAISDHDICVQMKRANNAGRPGDIDGYEAWAIEVEAASPVFTIFAKDDIDIACAGLSFIHHSKMLGAKQEGLLELFHIQHYTP